METGSLDRLQYVYPEELGIRSEDLAAIDIIVNEGLKEMAYPGVQVMVAKDGKVFYNKDFSAMIRLKWLMINLFMISLPSPRSHQPFWQ